MPVPAKLLSIIYIKNLKSHQNFLSFVAVIRVRDRIRIRIRTSF